MHISQESKTVEDPITSATSTNDKKIDIINGISICHRSVGSPSDPTILWIMGYGESMGLFEPVISSIPHFHHIIFDNRDTGNTKRFDEELPNASMYMAPDYQGEKPPIVYSLDDMADDAVAVLDHYGGKQKLAHIVGMSLGGSIAQIIMVKYPERCRSMGLFMSSLSLTKSMYDARQKNPEFISKYMNRAENIVFSEDTTLEQYVSRKTSLFKMVGATVNQDMIMCFEKDYERGAIDYGDNGAARQFLALAAFEAATDFESHVESLKHVTSVPTIVLHGRDDNLIPVESGRELAETIPGAVLVEYEGGHCLGANPQVELENMKTVIGFLSQH